MSHCHLVFSFICILCNAPSLCSSSSATSSRLLLLPVAPFCSCLLSLLPLLLPDPSQAIEPAAKEAEVTRRFSLTSSLTSSSSSFATRRTKGIRSAVQTRPAFTFCYFYIFSCFYTLSFSIYLSHSLLLHSHTQTDECAHTVHRVVQLKAYVITLR